MEKPVLVSCDSACDLSPEMREKYGIEITHMYVHQDGKVFRDGVDIDPDAIYATYEEKGILPTTSAIPPEEYHEFFQSWLKKGYAIVHIGLSSGISATCQDAMIAASEMENVYVIDSLGLSCGSGMLAVQACRMREQGMEAKEIAEKIQSLVPRSTTSFIVGSLTFLAKGGRCSTVTALGANLLGIKPAIEMNDGTLSVGKKYRGKDAFDKFLEDKLELAREESDGGIASIYHAGVAPEQFAYYVKLVEDSGIFSEVLTARAGSVISSHCGSETIGFTYQKK